MTEGELKDKISVLNKKIIAMEKLLARFKRQLQKLKELQK